MDGLQFFSRWLHVIAGITWIGHLYFFNFVNVPLQASLDDAAKKTVNPQLMPRALWWFRWGAMITFLSGLLLFTLIYAYVPQEGLRMPGLRVAGPWIMLGMTLGLIMWFNVWFIIWPVQKKMLSGRALPEELPALRRRAYLASRTNTYLSGPMLLGMLAANHLNADFFPGVIAWSAAALACTWVAIFHAAKVGKSV
ncbi:MAG: hypothetical protein A3J74_02210 [Elusimicrobia bacterium RIFCSPHIGHO2_02_FULL_57_9]|nr:MAG: hypothetical protein A3J74_02210 [Elusimicrobia bacterium RIFCSPHIGHO2_02_FULL_57_9]